MAKQNTKPSNPDKEPSKAQQAWQTTKDVANALGCNKTKGLQAAHEIHSFLDSGSLELSNALIKGEVAPMYGGGSFPAAHADVTSEQEATAKIHRLGSIQTKTR